MNEQIIILIFLVLALGATLWLYILKAKKQGKLCVLLYRQCDCGRAGFSVQ